MKRKLIIAICVGLWVLCGFSETMAQRTDGYVVAASRDVQADAEWMKVVEVLAKRHKATILYYKEKPTELLEDLRYLRPRYVAVVEKPERLNREFVMEGHRLSRKIDADIYADYLWGIITGYSAADAMCMVERSAEPFVIRTALNTTVEMSDGKYFDRFAFMSDAVAPGGWGEKICWRRGKELPDKQMGNPEQMGGEVQRIGS